MRFIFHPPPMTVPSWIMEDPPALSLEALRALTLKRFSRNACNFQLEFAQALLEGKKHVLLQAGCGMGKTLGFWILLLANPTGLLVVVSPLTLLGDQYTNASANLVIAFFAFFLLFSDLFFLHHFFTTYTCFLLFWTFPNLIYSHASRVREVKSCYPDL